MRKEFILLLMLGFAAIASLASAQERPAVDDSTQTGGASSQQAADEKQERPAIVSITTSNESVEKFRAAEREARRLAQQIRQNDPRGVRDIEFTPDGAALKAERSGFDRGRGQTTVSDERRRNKVVTDLLRPKVAEAFEARQKFLRAELAEFQRRLAEIEATITARERMKDAIIDKRVDELLNGTPAAPSSLAPEKSSDAKSGARDFLPPQPAIDSPLSRAAADVQAVELLWQKYGLKVRPIPQASLPGQQQHLHGGVEILEMSPTSQFRRDEYQVGDIIVGLQLWETLSASNVNFVLSKPEFQPDLDGTLKPINLYFLRGTALITAKFALEPRKTDAVVRDFDGDGDDDIGVFTAPRGRPKTGNAPLNEARPKKGMANSDRTSPAPATDLAPNKDQPLILRSAPDFGQLLEEATAAAKESVGELDAQLQELQKSKPAANLDDVKKQYPMIWAKHSRATGRLDRLREEYAAQIRLLKTELRDAELAAAAALAICDAVRTDGASQQKRLEAERSFNAAQSRVERAKILLELFLKVSEKANPSSGATKPDDPLKPKAN